MKHYSLRRVADSKDLQLVVTDSRSSQTAVYQYPPEQQYPLDAPRYYFDLPNLFVDIAAAVSDQWGDSGDSTSPSGAVHLAAGGEAHVGAVTLHSLARQAQRAVADGSGNSRRFKDGRDLFSKIEAMANTALESDVTSITDVLKSNNWKKSQPMRFVRANPDAWFVTNVFIRSNQQKDAIDIYQGTQAVFDTLLAKEDLDEASRSTVESFKTGQQDDCDFIAYGEVAQLLDDSNMLVFLDDASLTAWIRDEAKAKNTLHPSTPANVHIGVVQQVVDEDDPLSELGAHPSMTVTHFANLVSPRH
jgi:hypothetical protein